jgi:hypothetical protein
MVDGAAPAPPPTTKALAAKAAELAQVDALEKYGIPPDVPATVKAKVPVVVIGEPLTDIKPPVNVWPTEVTVPAPTGVAHVPSPRQKVNAEAEVPLLRLVTGRFPVTWVAKLTLDNVPPSVKLPLVVTVPVRVMPFIVPVPPTEVTVPVLEVLLLNVFQSVLVKYPFTEVVAAGIDIAGVLPPEDTTGAVPVTLVTVPPLDGAVLVTVKLG